MKFTVERMDRSYRRHGCNWWACANGKVICDKLGNAWTFRRKAEGEQYLKDHEATHVLNFGSSEKAAWVEPLRLTDQEKLALAGVVDLRNNHTVEHLPNGRIMVHPIDKTKVFQMPE